MISGEILGRVVLVGLSVGVAYLYWLAYREPNRSRLTRLVDAWVDQTMMPGASRGKTMLAVVAIMFVLAVVMAAELLAGLWSVGAGRE